MNYPTALLISTLSTGFAVSATAGCEVDLVDYVGWEILYAGTVTGYLDDNDQEQEQDRFEGCKYGRILIVDNNKKITCAEYNYGYAYRPDIVVMSDGFRFEACIDDRMYDVLRLSPPGLFW